MSNATGPRKLRSDAPGDPKARAAVERALAELRRGAGVVLVDDEDGRGAVVVAAAECARSAAGMMAAAGSVPACVIPATRAAALSLASGAEGNVVLAC
ncbi:MAG: hypothetical protein IMF05_02675, partial [Proteobacteria bacterium]|nr:hypothetical protein [Pseudomonadota bacterium]